MKSSMTFIQSNGCKEVDLILKKKYGGGLFDDFKLYIHSIETNLHFEFIGGLSSIISVVPLQCFVFIAPKTKFGGGGITFRRPRIFVNGPEIGVGSRKNSY